MNKTEGNKQLKCCPFCGGKAHIFTAPNGFYGIECLTVGCVTMPASYERSIEKLVRDWNTRKPVNRVLKCMENKKAAWEDESFRERKIAEAHIKTWISAINLVKQII